MIKKLVPTDTANIPCTDAIAENRDKINELVEAANIANTAYKCHNERIDVLEGYNGIGSSPTIKPCPFCGGEGVAFDAGEVSIDIKVHISHKENCRISGMNGFRDIEAWNTRKGTK